MAIPEEIKMQLMKIKNIDKLKTKYDKQKGGGRMRGSGFWEDLWSTVKKTVKDTNAWLKKTKAISTAGDIATGVLALVQPELAPEVAALTEGAKTLGYGKRTRGGASSVSARPLTLGTKGLYGKSYSGKPTNKKTLSQNGQFQNAIQLGSGTGSKKDNVFQPTTFNLVSSNASMAKIQK